MKWGVAYSVGLVPGKLRASVNVSRCGLLLLLMDTDWMAWSETGQHSGPSEIACLLPLLVGEEGWAWPHPNGSAERCTPSLKLTPGLAEPESYRPREASDWRGLFPSWKKNAWASESLLCVRQRRSGPAVGMRPNKWKGGGRGVWEERKDGWAPTTGDNTPCLEVCWVLDPCPVLALRDIRHVTQLASSLRSQRCTCKRS